MGNVSVWIWAGFFALVLTMLAIDLGVSRRRTGAMSLRTAALWSAIWIGVALLFNLGIYLWRGAEPALGALVAALEDKDKTVRAQSARALGRIGAPARAAAARLTALSRDSDLVVSREAQAALEAISPSP